MMAGALTFPMVLDGERAGGGQRAPKRPMQEAEFEQFYRKNAGGLWSYIFRLTGDPAAADDLLQKAFFRFLRATPAVESEEHMRRYLYKTATNLAFDHFREAKRDREHAAELVPLTFASQKGNDLRHDLMRFFGELKPKERAMLWLAHVEEADHDEIGAAVGVKSKSVRVLLFRARRKLADILTKNGLGPEAAR